MPTPSLAPQFANDGLSSSVLLDSPSFVYFLSFCPLLFPLNSVPGLNSFSLLWIFHHGRVSSFAYDVDSSSALYRALFSPPISIFFQLYPSLRLLFHWYRSPPGHRRQDTLSRHHRHTAATASIYRFLFFAKFLYFHLPCTGKTDEIV